MDAWAAKLLVLAGVSFAVGWALVLVSGHGGDSTGGSELVWRIGGVMVYASIPLLLLAAAVIVVARLRAAAGRRRRPS